MEGVAATNGVGLPPVGLLVGHAAAGSVIAPFVLRCAVRGVCGFDFIRLLSPFWAIKQESCRCSRYFTRLHSGVYSVQIIIYLNTEYILNVLSPSHAGMNT